jgi:hypothetical protein
MDEQTMAGTTLARRLVSSSAPRLALFTGISTFVVIFAIGYFVEKLRVSKTEDVTYALLFWLKFVAGPLALSTLLGVLSSRARHARHISPGQTAITVALVPFVALCTFLAAYLVLLSFHSGHYTPRFINFVFALAYCSVAIVVRWSVHLFCGLKKPSGVFRGKR